MVPFDLLPGHHLCLPCLHFVPDFVSKMLQCQSRPVHAGQPIFSHSASTPAASWCSARPWGAICASKVRGAHGIKDIWQPGKVIANKIKTNHTYLATVDYWAPLYDESEEDEQPEKINQIKETQPIVTSKTNKWTLKLVINSGATSNFVPEEMNLPKKGKSSKEVFLPDNTKLQASFTTELPFK